MAEAVRGPGLLKVWRAQPVLRRPGAPVMIGPVGVLPLEVLRPGAPQPGDLKGPVMTMGAGLDLWAVQGHRRLPVRGALRNLPWRSGCRDIIR